MSDTATEIVDQVLAEANGDTEAPAEEAKPVRAKKEPKPPVACACASLMLRDPEDSEALFTTECTSTTARMFAQGHDARAVSFLVSGQFDGYNILRQVGDDVLQYDDAAHAAFTFSDALGQKAQKAIVNAQTKLDAKTTRDQEREAKKTERLAAKEAAAADKAKAKAEKASAPKPVGAKVAEGSIEGDVAQSSQPVDVNAPVATQNEDGTWKVLIKVGRHTTDGELSADKQTVTYLDKDGAQQVREFDTVRCLSRFV